MTWRWYLAAKQYYQMLKDVHDNTCKGKKYELWKELNITLPPNVEIALEKSGKIGLEINKYCTIC